MGNEERSQLECLLQGTGPQCRLQARMPDNISPALHHSLEVAYEGQCSPLVSEAKALAHADVLFGPDAALAALPGCALPRC